MVRCCVLGCKSDSERKMPDLSFHSFPNTNNNLLPMWIKATRRPNWTPKISSRICSKHFENNMLIKKMKKTILVHDAVPLMDIRTHIPSMSYSECSSRNIEGNEDTHGHSNTVVTEGCIKFTASTSTKSPNYTPKTARRKLKRSQQISEDRLKKLRAIREKSRRLNKKIANLENIIEELKAKSFVTEEDGELLQSIDPTNKEFLKRFLNPTAGSKKFSPPLRKFALCLNFISPRAYKYVRQQFNTCLPHPSTLTSWYKSVNASPGFTTESLNCITLLAKRKNLPLYCAVSMDEMAIRRHVHWDGEKCIGLVDYGGTLDGDNIVEAREALVFMVTSINDGWKIPVGYFLTNGCNGEQKANLVKQCMQLLLKCKITITSLTFDGCPANLSMAKSLGCKLNTNEILKPFFEIESHEIVIIPDPAHMLKLVRNTLGQKKEIYNAEGEQISWKYIEKLNILQNNEGLHLANRLRNKHIDFKRQIMKVKLAAQTFSNSVAIAIQYCCKTLNLADFEGSDATVKFITIINNLFDILNSRTLRAYGFKKPICEKNGTEIINFLDEVEIYLKGLRIWDKNILESNRKVGFLGFVICISSIKKLYSDLILSGKLKFLPVYKLSQDHLECFFSAIRSKGGFNNNPTAFQFLSAYKRLVVHGEIKSIESGNCIPLEDIKILTHSEVKYEKKINKYLTQSSVETEDQEFSSFSHEDDNDHDYIADPSKLTLYANEIIPHIGGFVVKKLRKTLKCEDCLLALVSEKYAGLIFEKDKGGLNYPSTDVIKTCSAAEKILKRELHKGISFFGDKNIMPRLILNTLKQCFSLFLNDHFNNQPLVGNHRILLIKAIASYYLELRMHHATKSFEPKEKIRNIYNKLVLFSGQ